MLKAEPAIIATRSTADRTSRTTCRCSSQGRRSEVMLNRDARLAAPLQLNGRSLGRRSCIDDV